MTGFSIGVSGLLVGNRGLSVTGQNITNASTPGYRRQSLNTSERAYGNVGYGVEASWVTRAESAPLRTAILSGNARQGFTSARLDARRQIENSLGNGDDTAGGKLETLFNSIDRLTANPSDSTLRRQVLAAASDFAGKLNGVAADADRLKADLGGQATQAVATANGLTKQIAELNGKIYAVEVRGEQANELKDQRDQAVDDLSKLVDVRTVQQPHGVVNVIGRDTALVVSNTATTLTATVSGSGTLAVSAGGAPVRIAGGQLGGLLREYNVDIPATRDRIDAFANAAAGALDKLQATGLGLNGPLTSLVGSRPVNDPTQPLATQGLGIPVTAGTLTVSITNTSTQARTSAAIAINPATQSLNDIAAAITSGTGGQVTATVDTPDNVLRFTAPVGSSFDFAGRPDSPPAAVFAAPTTADTDSANLLAGAGMGGMFSGSGAGALKVRPELAADSNLLAAGRTGRSGDSTNLERLGAVRDQIRLNNRSLTEEWTDIAGSIGTDVRTLGDGQTSQSGLLDSLNAQEQSVVGVDINEELVKLVSYQRMMESASKFLSVMNSAMDEVMNFVR